MFVIKADSKDVSKNFPYYSKCNTYTSTCQLGCQKGVHLALQGLSVLVGCQIGIPKIAAKWEYTTKREIKEKSKRWQGVPHQILQLPQICKRAHCTVISCSAAAIHQIFTNNQYQIINQ
jgi:hypothetical protein